MKKEIWKRIVSAPRHHYECSNMGRIRRVNYDKRSPKYKYIKGQTTHHGYLSITLAEGWRKVAHRIIASVFIQNPNNLPFVNHINFDKQDNRVENLEWCTSKQNTAHANAAGKLGSPKVKITNLDTSEVYNGFKEIAEVEGCSYSAIKCRFYKAQRNGVNYKNYKYETRLPKRKK